MTTSTRERRDWTLLIFIIPIGIILMLIAGQIAIQLVPIWSINAGMQSNLDPNNLPNQQSGPAQPILPAILTPLGWFDTFLTPGADTENQIVFPPFVIFEPSATPVVTHLPPTAVTPPPVTPVTDTPIVTTLPPVTPTKKPPTSTPPTSTPPTSTPPTSTPPTSTPPTSTPPTSTPPTEVSITSTVPPSATAVTPAPADVVGTPDPQIYNLEDGTYIVLNLGSKPLQVTGSNPDYDLVYYEMEFSVFGVPSGNIYLDQVMIGITNDPTGGTFYTVFYWGDSDPDMNSNVGDIAVSTGGEADNQQIALSDLYGTDPYQTGIAIDVDNADSNPPVNSYQYVVIFAPTTGGGESANINAVEVIPEPPPIAGASVPSVDNVPAPPADNEPAPPADNEPAPPADNEPAPPADNEPAPPANNEPAPPADNEPAPPADNEPAPPADNEPAPPADNEPAPP